MTLTEVISKGRKFRRKSRPTYWFNFRDECLHVLLPENKSSPISIDGQMIIATDWEPEAITLNLSGTDIMECAKIISRNPVTQQRRYSVIEMAKLLIEELGLDQ